MERLKDMRVSTMAMILLQILLVVSIFVTIVTNSAVPFGIMLFLSIIDFILLLFFIIVNWRVKFSDIDWDDPFDTEY